MPTTNLTQRVQRIAGLVTTDHTELDGAGITTEDDLRYIDFLDLPAAIPVFKRRKLSIIGAYLASGKTLNTTITMDEVQRSLNQPVVTAGTATAASGTSSADINKAAPKIYTNPLPEFFGDAVDYEDWERKAGAIIKQSSYKDFISRPADPTDLAEVARSMELFNMILACVGSGHALNTVEKVRDDNAGLECVFFHGRHSRIGTLTQFKLTP